MVYIHYRTNICFCIIDRSINCTYFGIPLYGFDEEVLNVTTYELLSIDRQYFVRDMNMSTTLRCTDCTCDLFTGSSSTRQFWILIALFTVIVILIGIIDCLIKVIQRGHKKTE